MEKNNKATVAFILAMASIFFFIFWPATSVTVGILVAVLFAIAAIILGFAGKKIAQTTGNGKGLSVAAIVIGFIIGIFGLLGLLGMSLFDNPTYTGEACKQTWNVKDCVDKEDGTSECKIGGTVEIKCPTDVLQPSQFTN